LDKLHNEHLHKVFSSPRKITVIKSRWIGRTGEKRDAYGRLREKLKGKRLLGLPGCSLVDNIKMDLTQIEWGGMDRRGKINSIFSKEVRAF
jgi:hypothetical protein